MAKLSKRIASLPENELRALHQLRERGEYTTTLHLKPDENSESLATYYLHLSIKYKCYLVYAKYEYEAKTTTDAAGKNRIAVDRIKIEINSGNGWFDKSGKNTSRVKKLDEVYGKPACKKPRALASATVNGSSWSVKIPK